MGNSIVYTIYLVSSFTTLSNRLGRYIAIAVNLRYQSVDVALKALVVVEMFDGVDVHVQLHVREADKETSTLTLLSSSADASSRKEEAEGMGGAPCETQLGDFPVVFVSRNVIGCNSFFALY